MTPIQVTGDDYALGCHRVFPTLRSGEERQEGFVEVVQVMLRGWSPVRLVASGKSPWLTVSRIRAIMLTELRLPQKDNDVKVRR